MVCHSHLIVTRGGAKPGDGIDQGGAGCRERPQGRLEDGVGYPVVTEVRLVTNDTDAKSAQIRREGGNVRVDSNRTPGHCRILPVDGARSEHVEQMRHVRHRTRHWSSCVLTACHGDDSGATQQADRRFQPDQPTGCGWTEDGPISLRSNRYRRETGRDAGSGASTRTARGPVEREGV